MDTKKQNKNEEKRLNYELEMKFGMGIQTCIAHAFNINKSNISRALSGECEMKAAIYMTICNILDSEDNSEYILNNMENYIISNKVIGEVLHDLRTNQCEYGQLLNYKELEYKLLEVGIDNCSYSYIKKRENNKVLIKLYDLIAYGKVFNITIADIYDIAKEKLALR